MNAKLETVVAGIVVVAAVAAVVWVWRRGVGGVASDVASGAVQAVGGAVSGAVVGTAAVVGIPGTDKTECQKALAEGRWFDASLACPAADFIAAGGSAFYTWFSPPERTP